MKRIFLAILSFIYLSSATGADLRFHYCMGKFESWSFGHSEDKECGGCGMEKKAAEKTGCCKDEFKHLQLQVDQKSTNAPVYELHVIESASLLQSVKHATWQRNHEHLATIVPGNPVRRPGIATYIRNRVFRI